MNKFIFGLVSVASLMLSQVALADSPEEPYRPDISSSNLHHRFHVGFGMDVGVPSGAAVGLVINPWTDWARLQASLDYNYLSFGGRASLQFDPMGVMLNCPIGLFADVQGGFFPRANVPGHSDLPQVGYEYLNLYGGLRFGKPNSFHWNIEVGPSYFHATTDNFQAVVSKTGGANLTIGNPVASGWVVPTFATGFTVVFP